MNKEKFPDSEKSWPRTRLLGGFTLALVGTFGLAAFDSRYDDFVDRWREINTKD